MTKFIWAATAAALVFLPHIAGARTTAVTQLVRETQGRAKNHYTASAVRPPQKAKVQPAKEIKDDELVPLPRYPGFDGNPND